VPRYRDRRAISRPRHNPVWAPGDLDAIRDASGIAQLLTKSNHSWTIGQLAGMNREIEDAIKCCRHDERDRPRT
jgi:hypothetical protein